MERMAVTEARDHLDEALNRVAAEGERIVVHRGEVNIAALVSLDDLEFLERLEDRLDLEEARRAIEESRTEGTVAWEDVKNRLGI